MDLSKLLKVLLVLLLGSMMALGPAMGDDDENEIEIDEDEQGGILNRGGDNDEDEGRSMPGFEGAFGLLSILAIAGVIGIAKRGQ